MARAVEHERRATPRVCSFGASGIERARLRPGRTAHVIDLSAGGALIETDWRLAPGMRVELQLGEPTVLFKATARVLRCHVALLGRERIRYRGALVFEERLQFGEHTAPWVSTGQ
jgi:PilZ domain